jgi:hypothetical protein
MRSVRDTGDRRHHKRPVPSQRAKHDSLARYPQLYSRIGFAHEHRPPAPLGQALRRESHPPGHSGRPTRPAEASAPSPVPPYRYQQVSLLEEPNAKAVEDRASWAYEQMQTHMQIEALIRSGKPTETVVVVADATPLAARPNPGYRPWV